MSYRAWKAYWKKSHWTTKWFALFILLRPIADNFYQLKEVSVFLSPIYIIGVLTPLLAVMATSTIKKKQQSSPSDELMKFWLAMIIINCLLLLLKQFSVDNFGDCIKYISPPIVFFYLRKVISNKEDLHFFLLTFLYSCIFPFLMMYFEILIHPITPEFASDGRGGGVRIRGTYADSMNYAIFLVGSFMIYGYFFLHDTYSKAKVKQTSVYKIAALFVICLVGIISLRHVSTWAVFLGMIVVLMYYNSQNLKGLALVLFIGAIVVPFFADTIYQKQIRPLIEKEFSVISGDKDVSYAFDGRMSRWQRYFEIWDKQPSVSHYIGVGFSGAEEAFIMVSGGMHNDYIRILFLTGWIGVIVYVLFFLFLLWRRKFLNIPERFLLISSVLIFMMYSISTVPTLYGDIYSMTFPVFCFAVLPVAKAYSLKPRRLQQPFIQQADATI